jgi:hypothetical protein
VKDFDHRHAGHCESGTVAALLRHNGLSLSEPMVFGIGGGLFFLHLPLIRMGGIPLTSYRDAPRAIVKNIGKRLGIRWQQHRYRRQAAGSHALDAFLAAGRPVGVQTSIYWLPYFPVEMRFHFNGHNLVVYGKQGEDYLISDPVIETIVTCPRGDLERARFAKGPFAPRGLIYYPEQVPVNPDLKEAVGDAIRTTARRMVNTPIPFFGVRGIYSLANKMERWPEKLGLEKARLWVGSVVRMQEEIGTGGAGFRFIYAAFLQEAAELLGNVALRESARDLTATGDRWRDFAVQGALLVKNKRDDGATYAKLANLLRECADRELEIFTRLKSIV